MTTRHRPTLPILLTLLLLLMGVSTQADDHSDDRLQQLRDTMYYYFDNGIADKFHESNTAFMNYSLSLGDYNSYYNGWANRVIFELNESNIFQAYKQALALSRDMRQRHQEEYRYMATGALGLIYADCSNLEGARQCFEETIGQLKEMGMTNELVPLYMDLAYITIEKYPDEALQWLQEALRLSQDESTLCDASAFNSLLQFKQGNMKAFLEQYEQYKQLEQRGMTSIYGKFVDIYYACYQHDYQQAEQLANAITSPLDHYEYLRSVYEHQGDSLRAYRVLRRQMEVSDSLNSIILTDNLRGISNELEMAEAQQSEARHRIVALLVVAIAALLVVVALVYIILNRRRFTRQLTQAHNELEKSYQELTVANARAEESSKMKTNFIQQISHEIRTPLNILSGYTQIVTSPDMVLDDATKRDINLQISENTNRITELVNKMLELSDANSQTIIECNDAVPAVQIASQAVEDSGIMQAPHLNFSMHLPDDAEGTMLTGTNLMAATRALVLLLDNAQKFTHPAEAHHRNEAVVAKKAASLTLRTDDSGMHFIVEDTGIGVPPQEAEHIFEEFVQLDEYYDGTGIGLTVARSITQRLGGNIVLDTTYSDGARFVMTQPIEH